MYVLPDNPGNDGPSHSSAGSGSPINSSRPGVTDASGSSTSPTNPQDGSSHPSTPSTPSFANPAGFSGGTAFAIGVDTSTTGSSNSGILGSSSSSPTSFIARSRVPENSNHASDTDLSSALSTGSANPSDSTTDAHTLHSAGHSISSIEPKTPSTQLKSSGSNVSADSTSHANSSRAIATPKPPSTSTLSGNELVVNLIKILPQKFNESTLMDFIRTLGVSQDKRRDLISGLYNLCLYSRQEARAQAKQSNSRPNNASNDTASSSISDRELARMRYSIRTQHAILTKLHKEKTRLKMQLATASRSAVSNRDLAKPVQQQYDDDELEYDADRLNQLQTGLQHLCGRITAQTVIAPEVIGKPRRSPGGRRRPFGSYRRSSIGRRHSVVDHDARSAVVNHSPAARVARIVPIPRARVRPSAAANLKSTATRLKAIQRKEANIKNASYAKATADMAKQKAVIQKAAMKMIAEYLAVSKHIAKNQREHTRKSIKTLEPEPETVTENKCVSFAPGTALPSKTGAKARCPRNSMNVDATTKKPKSKAAMKRQARKIRNMLPSCKTCRACEKCGITRLRRFNGIRRRRKTIESRFADRILPARTTNGTVRKLRFRCKGQSSTNGARYKLVCKGLKTRKTRKTRSHRNLTGARQFYKNYELFNYDFLDKHFGWSDRKYSPEDLLQFEETITLVRLLDSKPDYTFLAELFHAKTEEDKIAVVEKHNEKMAKRLIKRAQKKAEKEEKLKRRHRLLRQINFEDLVFPDQSKTVTKALRGFAYIQDIPGIRAWIDSKQVLRAVTEIKDSLAAITMADDNAKMHSMTLLESVADPKLANDNKQLDAQVTQAINNAIRDCAKAFAQLHSDATGRIARQNATIAMIRRIISDGKMDDKLPEDSVEAPPHSYVFRRNSSTDRSRRSLSQASDLSSGAVLGGECLGDYQDEFDSSSEMDDSFEEEAENLNSQVRDLQEALGSANSQLKEKMDDATKLEEQAKNAGLGCREIRRLLLDIYNTLESCDQSKEHVKSKSELSLSDSAETDFDSEPTVSNNIGLLKMLASRVQDFASDIMAKYEQVLTKNSDLANQLKSEADKSRHEIQRFQYRFKNDLDHAKKRQAKLLKQIETQELQLQNQRANLAESSQKNKHLMQDKTMRCRQLQSEHEDLLQQLKAEHEAKVKELTSAIATLEKDKKDIIETYDELEQIHNENFEDMKQASSFFEDECFWMVRELFEGLSSKLQALGLDGDESNISSHYDHKIEYINTMLDYIRKYSFYLVDLVASMHQRNDGLASSFKDALDKYEAVAAELAASKAAQQTSTADLAAAKASLSKASADLAVARKEAADIKASIDALPTSAADANTLITMLRALDPRDASLLRTQLALLSGRRKRKIACAAFNTIVLHFSQTEDQCSARFAADATQLQTLAAALPASIQSNTDSLALLSTQLHGGNAAAVCAAAEVVEEIGPRMAELKIDFAKALANMHGTIRAGEDNVVQTTVEIEKLLDNLHEVPELETMSASTMAHVGPAAPTTALLLKSHLYSALGGLLLLFALVWWFIDLFFLLVIQLSRRLRGTSCSPFSLPTLRKSHFYAHGSSIMYVLALVWSAYTAFISYAAQSERALWLQANGYTGEYLRTLAMAPPGSRYNRLLGNVDVHLGPIPSMPPTMMEYWHTVI